jgi:hypothetical protein
LGDTRNGGPEGQGPANLSKEKNCTFWKDLLDLAAQRRENQVKSVSYHPVLGSGWVV